MYTYEWAQSLVKYMLRVCAHFCMWCVIMLGADTLYLGTWILGDREDLDSLAEASRRVGRVCSRTSTVSLRRQGSSGISLYTYCSVVFCIC